MDWPRGKINDIFEDMGVRLFLPTLKQAKPALAPVFVAQAILCFCGKAIDTGKSPMVETGLSTIFLAVGLRREMLNMDTVLLPGLTAERVSNS